MDRDTRKFMRPENAGDATSLELSSMLDKWENELKIATYPSTSPLSFFLRVGKAVKTANAEHVYIAPAAQDILEDGVFDLARVESARLIIDEVKEMYDVNLSEVGRLNITNNSEHEDRVNQKVEKAFERGSDPTWIERKDAGRKMGIVQTLRDFSGKFTLGIYDQEDIEKIAYPTYEGDFGTSYFLPTKFPNIGVKYYYIDEVDANPEISYVINPVHL